MDRCQLPPINELISTVFTTVKTVALTEVVRQSSSNPINLMINIAKKDVNENSNKFPIYIEANRKKDIKTNEEGIKEGFIISSTGLELKDTLYSLFSETKALYDYTHVKIVAFTNDKVKQYNKLIKDVVNPSTLPISADDWLLGYSPFKVKQKSLTQNGMYYKVITAQLKPLTVMGVELMTILTRLRFTDTDEYGNPITSEIMLTILHPDSHGLFYPMVLKAWLMGKERRNWKPYYNLIAFFAVSDDFVYEGYIDSYGKQKKETILKKNIDLGYAITVHKSQGMTFNNTYIDYQNFAKCFEPSTKARLVYVATSRSRYINLIYG